MKVNFNITPRAKADLNNIWDYTLDIHDNYYSFAQGQHVIFYLIRDNSIDIIGVPHRSMDIQSFFDD